MTESPDIQISEFADGELGRDESEFLVRRLSRDADARCKTVRYATIGAAIRGELIGPDPDVLRRRISASLEGVHVPEHAPASVPNPRWRVLRPVAGLGIAASVAIAALLAVNPGPGSDSGSDTPPVAIVETVPTVVPVQTELMPSFVVPVSATSQPSLRFTDYLVQHNRFAPAIRRVSINSSIAGEQHTLRRVQELQTAE
ncbi:MAG: sigma-E factor negative regulatory protein [Gammaproteobacteria bacterium]|nr:sigma-E factor negative regulatory protein [Gammaproteobacteria bacterium]